MARKSSINHAVTVLFSITGKELAAQLSDFCAIKKLGWSPDVKVAMAKMPAQNIADAAWAVLDALPVQKLQDILADLLKPIKQHSLFDLADWVRDLDNVPESLQTYWSNTRIPKMLDDLVRKALKPNGTDNGDEDAGWKDETPRKSVRKSFKAAKPKRGGKVSKADMRPDANTEPAGADAQLNSFGVPLKEAAVDALTSAGIGDKLRWTRVNKYVQAVMAQYGFTFRSSPKREVDPDHPDLARVTYFVTEKDRTSWSRSQEMIAHLEGAFGKSFDSYEELENEKEVTQFKLWFKHAG